MKQESAEIDKLFNALKDYSAKDKEGNWELMRHLLKEQKKKQLFFRKIKIAGFSFAMLLAAFGVFWFSAHYNTHTQNNAFLSKNTQNTKKITPTKKQTTTTISLFDNKKEITANIDENIHRNNPIKSKEKKSTTINKSPLWGFRGHKTNNYQPKVLGDNNSKNSSTQQGISYFALLPQTYKYSTTKDSFKVKITKLGNTTNTDFIDFGTVITADGATMYFTSNKPVTDKGKKKHKAGLENIYVSQYNEAQKQWSLSTILPSVINVEGRNNSVIGLSNDGQKMFLYQDIKGVGDIYKSNLKGLQWSEPKRLPEPINSKYHESSASLSPDERTIYFVSERPGGKGEKDIWSATKDENGNWGNPINLKNINTPQDEEAVFIAPDNKTMYFSSKGHHGFGGYDIYKSYFENGQWSKPVNLGKPINTPGDDIYLVMEANGTQGYYTSRKPGEKNSSIYKVNFIPIKIKKEYMAKLTLFKCKVIDKATQKPLGAKIEISDLIKNNVIATLHSNSATGKALISLPFGINYGITVKKPGYLFYSQNINIAQDSAYKEVVKTIPLVKNEKGNRFTLRNIFFDYDKATLKKTSYTELKQLLIILKQYPTMKIEIAGYTDNIGSDAYNMKLSQARTQSVANYLINNGIDKNRLIPKGYGEANPIAPNQNPDGSDNPAGRQLNRRIEIKIL